MGTTRKRKKHIPSIFKSYNLNDARLCVNYWSNRGVYDLDRIEIESGYPKIITYYAIRNSKSLSHIHERINPVYTLKQLYLIERSSSLLMPLKKTAIIANVDEDLLRIHKNKGYWEVYFSYKRDMIKLIQDSNRQDYELDTGRMSTTSSSESWSDSSSEPLSSAVS